MNQFVSFNTALAVLLAFGMGSSLVAPKLGAEDEPSSKSFVEQLSIKSIPRPSGVSDRLDAKTIDYVFDGIPSTRMDMVHPSIVFSNMVFPEWNLKPAGYEAHSIAFIHRTFQDTSLSITLFKKGSYIDATDTDSLLGVAADLYQKYGDSITFEPWQNDKFSDPNMPDGLVPHMAKAIGFTVVKDGIAKVVRRYYCTIGLWMVEITYEGNQSSFGATYPSFEEYINRLSITEQE